MGRGKALADAMLSTWREVKETRGDPSLTATEGPGLEMEVGEDGRSMIRDTSNSREGRGGVEVTKVLKPKGAKLSFRGRGVEEGDKRAMETVEIT